MYCKIGFIISVGGIITIKMSYTVDVMLCVDIHTRIYICI